MLHLKLFEEFTRDELVTVKGELGKVVSDDGNEVVVKFLKSRRTKIVDKGDVQINKKCLSQCDKRIVGEGDDRYIKCFYCNKEQRFRSK